MFVYCVAFDVIYSECLKGNDKNSSLKNLNVTLEWPT